MEKNVIFNTYNITVEKVISYRTCYVPQILNYISLLNTLCPYNRFINRQKDIRLLKSIYLTILILKTSLVKLRDGFL